MSSSAMPKDLGQVVSLLSLTLDQDSAHVELSSLDQRTQDAIHRQLWIVMQRPDYQDYGRIAFSDPSQLPKELPRPTAEQRHEALVRFLKPFRRHITLTPQNSRIALIPKGHIQHVFSFLSPEDLARASSVCKNWNAVPTNNLWRAFDLKKVVSGLKILDERVWERHADLDALEINPTGALPINKRQAIPFLISLSKQVDRNAGITLLTMPKGLTLNKLIEFAEEPKRGRAAIFNFLWPSIRDRIGNVAVPETHTIAITNSILKNSRSECRNEHIERVEKHRADLPSFLPTTALIFLTHISSSVIENPTCLFPVTGYSSTGEHVIGTRTRIKELFNEKDNVILGSFGPPGLQAYYLSPDPNQYCGIAAMQKL